MRSALKRKLTWPPMTRRPPANCAKPTDRWSPSLWFDTSTKSSTRAPGASNAICAARCARANRSAIAGDAFAPGAGKPEPQIRFGTAVATSHDACHDPRAANARHAGLALGAYEIAGCARSGRATFAPGIAVNVLARGRAA